MKKIIVIPDSFKGTLSSRQAGQIIQQEACAAFPAAQVQALTVADGGEGCVDAFLSALPGTKHTATVQGPFGQPVESFYGMVGKTAIIEMAAAAGLPLALPTPDPCRASTYGAGQLMARALAQGAEKIILGLGGSATNDGGTGAAAALGAQFLDADGHSFLPTGGTLQNIARIDLSCMEPRLAGVPVQVMCDIDNPLYGPQGAAAVFAPQKGATPAQVQQLDAGLRHLSEIIQTDLGKDIALLPGAGAAGGMGGGAAAFWNARLLPGIEIMLDTIGFDSMLEGCSLVVTGEGRIDGQSVRGKVIAGIARRAKAKGVPVVALVGDIGLGAEEMYPLGVSAIFSINRVAVPYAQAKLRAEEDLRQTARTVFSFARLAKTLE